MEFTTTKPRRHEGTTTVVGTFTGRHPARPRRGACDAPLRDDRCHRAFAASRLRDCEPVVDHGSRASHRDRRRGSPRQLAAVAHDAAGRGDHRAVEGRAPRRGWPRGVVDDAPPAGRARAPRGRAADRPGRGRERSALVGCAWRRRRVHAGGHRVCQEERRRTRRPRGDRDAEGPVPRCPQASARAGLSRCAARRHDGVAARTGVPEVDELGRVARRRQGRPPIRPSRAMAALSLRRPGRPLRHPAGRGRPVAAGAGRAIGRDDVRPPLSHDERARRARRQGQDLRRLQSAPARELRRPRT